MRIEHVAMYVNDIEGAKSFFERYLGAAKKRWMNLPGCSSLMATR